MCHPHASNEGLKIRGARKFVDLPLKFQISANKSAENIRFYTRFGFLDHFLMSVVEDLFT